MTRHLVYVTDPMCSWCWGFAPVIDTLMAALDLPVRVIAGGLAPGEAGRVMSADMRSTIAHHWESVEKASGQPFDHAAFEARADDWRYDTLHPNMALVAVRHLAPERALEALHRMQRAFYAEGRDVTDKAVLAEVLGDLVPDPVALATALADPALEAATYDEFRSARELGVQGFPTLFVRDGVDWALAARGWAPAETLLAGIRGWLAERDAEAEPAGQACVIDDPSC